MVVISLALAFEGMVGIFEARNQQIEAVLFPVAIVFRSVSVTVGLGIHLRLTRTTDAETVEDEPRTTDRSSRANALKL